MSILGTCAVGCVKGCVAAAATAVLGPAALLVGTAYVVGKAITNENTSNEDEDRKKDDD